MTIPTLLVEADFTNKPTSSTRTWTDITKYARAANWTRSGRSAETEQTQPGQASLQLANYDDDLGLTRIFDKDNQASPYYPALAWSFWLRISIVWDGVTYRRWAGIKSGLPKTRPQSGKDRVATLSATDALSVLNLVPLAGKTYASQTPGNRITSVLSDASATAGTIDPGKDTLTFPAVTFADDDTTAALSHLQQVETDERGFLFADGSGAIVFHDRYHRAANLTPVATLGENAGDIRYVQADLDDETSYQFNVVKVTPAGGTTETAIDTDSADANFQRLLPLSMLSDVQAEARHNASWYMHRYANPSQRLGTVEVLGGRDPSTWPTILGAENGDLFAYEGGDVSATARLERVSESWLPGQPLTVSWDLSPGDRDNLWQLGVHGASELGVGGVGSTARLG